MPEALETGEYKVGGTAEFDDLEPVNVIAYSGNTVPTLPYGGTTQSINQGGFTVNGIENSIALLITKPSSFYQQNAPFKVLMNAMLTDNFSDYIVACFTVPYLAVKDFMVSSNLMPRK